MYKHIIRVTFCIVITLTSSNIFAGAEEAARDGRITQLAEEIKSKGWIVYSSRSKNRTWDLFLCRPDGSNQRNITNTADFEEAAPRFSPDGTKILYRRLIKGTEINHDRWGFSGRLVIADANGANQTLFGEEKQYPWATWSPDGKKIACLTLRGIIVVDIAAKKVVRRFRRQGTFQQLYWSPDGKWFCGVGNTLGMWTIVRLNAETGELNPVHRFQNCAPDWFPDSKHVIFSSRPGNQRGYGWTQLWMAQAEGKDHRLLCGEDGFHIYGGALSPEAKYVLFTKCLKDGGGSEESGAPIYVMRFSDAPIITGKSQDLRKIHPDTNDGPILRIGRGWEPHWTYAEPGESK